MMFYPNDKKDTGNKLICARLAFAILLAGLILPMVSAYEMDRSAPSQVNPGQAFTVIYSIEAPQEGMYVSWNDKVSGGCSPMSISDVMQSSISTTSEKTFVAPNNNTKCVFSGYYEFQDGITRNFPTFSIQIGTPPAPVIPEANVTYVTPVTNQSVTNVTSPQTSSFNLTSITSKFAFFHILGNDNLEGIIVIGLLVFVGYKLLK